MNKTVSHGLMGEVKHRGSGWKNGAGKSPKFRHAEKRNAEKNVRKPRPAKWFASVSDAFRSANE